MSNGADRLQAGSEATPHTGERPLTAQARLDWEALYTAFTGLPAAAVAPPATPASARPIGPECDSERLEPLLPLACEIGQTKDKLHTLTHKLLLGHANQTTLNDLDQALSQLDRLVADLDDAIMAARMQPIGRLLQDFPGRLRDLAGPLGKEVELKLAGEETELDRAMFTDLDALLMHLIRHIVVQDIEPLTERQAAGKPTRARLTLSASQVGDHIRIEIADDGRGSIDMDATRPPVDTLKARLDSTLTPGQGGRHSVWLPLTLATLPVLVVDCNDQSFALPLSQVESVVPIAPGMSTDPHDAPPRHSLARLLAWEERRPPTQGVLLHVAGGPCLLTVDGCRGRRDIIVKPLSGIQPQGIAGAALAGDGSLMLVLDMAALLAAPHPDAPALPAFPST